MTKRITQSAFVLLAMVHVVAKAQSSFEVVLPSGETAVIEKWRKFVDRDGLPFLSFSYTASGKLDDAKARDLGKNIWAVLASDIHSQEVCYASVTIWEPLNSAGGVRVYVYNFLDIAPTGSINCKSNP